MTKTSARQLLQIRMLPLPKRQQCCAQALGTVEIAWKLPI